MYHDCYSEFASFTSGGLDAKKLAVPVIERIERLTQNL